MNRRERLTFNGAPHEQSILLRLLPATHFEDYRQPASAQAFHGWTGTWQQRSKFTRTPAWTRKERLWPCSKINCSQVFPRLLHRLAAQRKSWRQLI